MGDTIKLKEGITGVAEVGTLINKQVSIIDENGICHKFLMFHDIQYTCSITNADTTLGGKISIVKSVFMGCTFL